MYTRTNIHVSMVFVLNCTVMKLGGAAEVLRCPFYTSRELLLVATVKAAADDHGLQIWCVSI